MKFDHLKITYSKGRLSKMESAPPSCAAVRCSSLNFSSKPSVFMCQILVYEGEMERAQVQLEVEMQNLEEEKNREIEEAFIRAESEMKAVHENLAGQSFLRV